MKRTLIKYDAFQKIEKDSLSAAERELVEAQDVLARALGVDDLHLHCFGESDVTYSTLDGTYVHANYKMNENHIIFESLEELVVDESTEKQTSRKLLSDFVESLLDDNEAKAAEQFGEFMKLPFNRRIMKNASLAEAFDVTASKPTGHSPLAGRKQNRSDVAKRIRSMRKTKKKLKASPGLANSLDAEKSRVGKQLGGGSNKRWRVYARKVNKSKLHEWAVLSENVLDYVDFKELGPALKDSYVQRDDKGGVTGVAVPRSHARNEGKILSFNWKTLDHEVKYSRSGAKNLKEDVNFCRAISELKKHNAVSDNNALIETLEGIVSHWPQVLFLTQQELAETIGGALSAVGVLNYDDQMCEFMAEGILRTAHKAFVDRAKKIIDLSQLQPTVESKDAYVIFKDIVDRFYPSLDESERAQYQVFADLYRALHEIYRMVDQEGDEVAKAEIHSYMEDCEAILNKHAEPSLELAETIAIWLTNITESNVEMSSDTWNVSNDVHTTISGDHPRMKQLATVAGIPGKYPGDWGSELPVSDGKSYKGNLDDEMRNSWANYGGPDTFPDIRNPYVPKPFGDYTMKGGPGVDKTSDEGLTQWQSKDTWPNLQNPEVKESPWRPGHYKMKSDNLIEDK
jgi:hypothetical protein